MVFELLDGSHLYQYDTGRVLKVLQNDITQVHFSNSMVKQAIVMPVVEEEGIRVAHVPDYLLQFNCNIIAYAYIETSGTRDYTRIHENIGVIGRDAPGDYVPLPYKEKWNELQEEIDDLETVFTEHKTDTEIHVTEEEKEEWNSKYTFPTTGIPQGDLSASVQESLSKADTALQEHQSLSAYRTATDQDAIDSTKVDKETGKGLSSNDYTSSDKNKLDGIEAEANKYVLPTATATRLGGIKVGENLTITEDGVLSSTGGGSGGGDMYKATYDTNNSGVVDNAEKLDGHTASYFAAADSVPTSLSQLSADSTHRLVTDTEKSTWNGKADSSDIPTKTSDLTNDSGFITEHNTFVAKYGTTTYAEIKQAREEDYDVVLMRSSYQYQLNNISDAQADFSCVSNGSIRTATCFAADNRWSNDNASVQMRISSSNKVSVNYIDGLSTVATSGNYDDLSNKPTIPTIPSEFTDIMAIDFAKWEEDSETGLAYNTSIEEVYPSNQYDVEMFPVALVTDTELYSKITFLSHVNDTTSEIDNIIAISDSTMIGTLINEDIDVGIRVREKVTV